jgi:outer membrane protein assembly factor BamB
MSDADFVTQLRLQLREAAEREARRGSAGRAMREASARRLWRPALALAALALLVIGLIGAARGVDRHRTTPAGHGLHLLLRTPLVGQGGGIWPGFGAMWANDASTGELLRIDPRTHAVRTRTQVGQVSFDVGAGAVWANDGQRLLKVDAATGRVLRRIPLPRQPSGGVLVGRDTVWVGDRSALDGIDPRTLAVRHRIRLAHGGFLANGFATDGRNMYLTRADGTLLVFDAHTGAQRPSPGVPVEGTSVGASHGVVYLATEQAVSALDVRTARTRWSMELPTKTIDYVVLGAGRVWAEGIDRDSGRDRLWRLDAATGRVTGSIELPEFGASGMATHGDRVWIVSTKGVLEIVG